MFLSYLLVLFSLINNAFSSAHDNTIYSSCKEAFEKACNPENGGYRVKTQTDLGYIEVYCTMSTIDQCIGGGWTPVIKIAANKPTFFYNSSYWTNKESLKTLNGLNRNPSLETKLPTYWSTELKEICLVNMNNLKTILIRDYQALSLYHLIAENKNRSINITLQNWITFAGITVTNSQCIEQGLNIGGNSNDYSRARLGVLISNVTDGCHQATNWIGVGVDDLDEANSNQLISTSAGYYGSSGYVPLSIIIYVR